MRRFLKAPEETHQALQDDPVHRSENIGCNMAYFRKDHLQRHNRSGRGQGGFSDIRKESNDPARRTAEGQCEAGPRAQREGKEASGIVSLQRLREGLHEREQPEEARRDPHKQAGAPLRGDGMQ